MEFTNVGVRKSSSKASVVSGGTEKQRALVRSLIAAIDGNAIRSVTIGRPPNGMRPVPSIGLYGNTYLTIRVRAYGSEPIADLAATWKMDLLAGAFRDTAKARGLATLLGYRGLIEYPPGRSPLGDSKLRHEGSGIAGSFVHDLSEEAPEALATRIRRQYERIAQAAGITRLTVSFVSPIKHAVIVDVNARNPRLALHGSTFLWSLGVEGLMLRVRMGEGKPFAVVISTARAQTGGSWGAGPGSERR